MIDDVEDDLAEDGDFSNTFLTFTVAAEEYAVSVSCVTEIVRLQKSYSIPDVPSYVRGVINLRGKVIPLIDMRSRLGMPESAYTDRTVVVVLEVADAATGLIVDAVAEVAEILPEQIEARPPGMSRGTRALVTGVGKRASGVSFVLNVEAMLELGADERSQELSAQN
jgi:purine-binding chemotaxis protein CheW